MSHILFFDIILLAFFGLFLIQEVTNTPARSTNPLSTDHELVGLQLLGLGTRGVPKRDEWEADVTALCAPLRVKYRPWRSFKGKIFGRTLELRKELCRSDTQNLNPD